MQANLPGLLTLVAKIIQLIFLADVMFANQFLNYTLAFYRQKNTLAHLPGIDKVEEEVKHSTWTLLILSCQGNVSSKRPTAVIAQTPFLTFLLFSFKETISNGLLIGNMQVSLKRIHTTQSKKKAETIECYE